MELNLNVRQAKDLGGALTTLPKAPKRPVIPDRFLYTPKTTARSNQKSFVETVAKLYSVTPKQVEAEVLPTPLGTHLWRTWQAGEVRFPSVLPLAPNPPAWVRTKINDEATDATLQQLSRAPPPPNALHARPAAKPARAVNPQLDDTALKGGASGPRASSLQANFTDVRNEAIEQWGNSDSTPARNKLAALVTVLDDRYAALNTTTFDRTLTHIDVTAGAGLALRNAIETLRAAL